MLHEEGVINTASAIVGYDKRYEGIINHLLGRIIVTENIDSALRLAKKYKYSRVLSPIDGELLNPGGALSGGAYKKPEIFSDEAASLKNYKNGLTVLKQRLMTAAQKSSVFRNVRVK